MNLEIEIDDPRQIRQVSDSIFQIARDNNLSKLPVGLDHDHFSIVRGRGEDFRGLNRFSFGTDYPVEVIREDGGDSWVHSPESRCYEEVEQIGRQNSKSHQRLMQKWGEQGVDEILNFLDGRGDSEIDPVYQSGDIYDARTGRQIAGLSLETRGDYMLKRMCFYDGREHGETFNQLIDTDLSLADREGRSLEDPRKAGLELPGFYDYMIGSGVDGDISFGELRTGEPSENARNPEYCISYRPDLKNS